MSRYDWAAGNLPELKNHSKCKHEILHDYLIRYITVLHTGTLKYRNKKFNLTIVDGCAGGGRFQIKGRMVDGSPFVILNTIREVVSVIQTERKNNGFAEIEFNIDVICVEKNKKVASFLNEQLQMEGFSTEKIQVIHGDFNKHTTQITDFIKKKSGGKPGRCLFFLDQYGYSQIEIFQVRNILHALHSEVILTFAVDYLVDYLSASNSITLQQLKIPPAQIEHLLQLSTNTKGNRHTIEHILARHIQISTGAKFYTPFFIRGDDTHRGYWLVHLSSHYRARDEMMNIHWDKGTMLHHFGSAGIDMLGYRSDNDESYTRQSSVHQEFLFDHHGKKEVLVSIQKELPKFIHSKKEIMFKDIMSEIFNHTPAKREFIVEAMKAGIASGEFSTSRKNVDNIKDSDIIKSSAQKVITFKSGK